MSFYKFTNIFYIELFVLISSTIVLSPQFIPTFFYLSWNVLVSFPQHSSYHELFEHSSLRFFPQDLTSSDTIFPLVFECLDSCFPLFALFFIPPYLHLFISSPVSRPCNFFLKESEQGTKVSLLLLFLLDNRVFLIYRNQTMKLLSPAPFIKFLFHVSSTLPRFTTNLNQVDFNKEKVNQLSQHTNLYLSLTFYFILFYPCMDFHTKMERLIIVIFSTIFF